MLLLFLLSFVFSTTLGTFFAVSPVLMGALILVLALELSLVLRVTTSSWFGFLLFLIYIGGLLVIFSYFAALTPNLPSRGKSLGAFFFFLLVRPLIPFSFLFAPPLNFIELCPPALNSSLCIFIDKNLPLLAFLVTILFFALIIVVRVSLRSTGPLRPFQPRPYV